MIGIVLLAVLYGGLMVVCGGLAVAGFRSRDYDVAFVGGFLLVLLAGLLALAAGV
jgi:hypothetical protein